VPAEASSVKFSLGNEFEDLGKWDAVSSVSWLINEDLPEVEP
jgi:hypothetical protein